MKRSTSKLYKPWFGIAFALLAVVLVLACGGVENLETETVTCTEGDEYDRNDYAYNTAQIKSAIIEAQLTDMGVYIPYLNSYYTESEVRMANNLNATIDHIVPISSAHWSGLCNESLKVRQEFANDLLNITLAPADLNNNQKGDHLADEWAPDNNKCWFADTVVQVRHKYNLTASISEQAELKNILEDCASVELENTQ